MKKLWKKLLAVTTAVMMAITLLPAMANAETEIEPEPATTSTIAYDRKGSITINKTTNVKKEGSDEYEPLDHAQFTLYRIASLDENGYTMLVNDVNGYTTPESLLNLDKEKQKEVASLFANSAQTKGNRIDTKTTGESGESTGQVRFTNLDLGYYLVVETSAPEGYVASVPFFVSIPTSNTADDSKKNPANEAATSWSYDVVARPKNESVSIDKKIVEGDTRKDTTQAGVGDTISYEITSVSPKYTQEYFMDKGAQKDPTYAIHDTLSVGLTYNKDLQVTIEGKTLDNSYYSVDDNDRGFVLTFTTDFLKKEEYKGKTVKVNYTAIVNKNAVVGTDGNTNEVSLDYNRTPGSDTTSATGTTIPKVYTYGLKLTKKDSKDNAALLGAEFKIYEVKGNQEIQITNLDGMTDGIYTTDSNGLITIKGLNAGTYRLEEVKAPEGYTLLKDKIEFTISAGSTTIDGSVATTTTGFAVDGATGYVKTTVLNNKGFNLPATGGMGTYLFTIGGLVIMAGAALLLIASKKRRA